MERPVSRHERRMQKSRTREALLAAARDLIAEGCPVTVADAAARARISKATAYRYFSDPGSMAAEAGLAIAVLPYEEIVAGAATPRERVRAVSLYFLDLSLAHERAFRQFVARALDASLAVDPPRFQRGARRIPMFERALEGTGLAAAERSALVLALTAATGSEAMIALFDIGSADPETARRTVVTIADALLDRFLGGGAGERLSPGTA